ncbi:hypothetical protein [Calothrix sp. NIES-2098]
MNKAHKEFTQLRSPLRKTANIAQFARATECDRHCRRYISPASSGTTL